MYIGMRSISNTPSRFSCKVIVVEEIAKRKKKKIAYVTASTVRDLCLKKCYAPSRSEVTSSCFDEEMSIWTHVLDCCTLTLLLFQSVTFHK